MSVDVMKNLQDKLERINWFLGFMYGAGISSIVWIAVITFMAWAGRNIE